MQLLRKIEKSFWKCKNNNSETEENISEENELDDDENFKQFRKAIKTIEVIG